MGRFFWDGNWIDYIISYDVLIIFLRQSLTAFSTDTISVYPCRMLYLTMIKFPIWMMRLDSEVSMLNYHHRPEVVEKNLQKGMDCRLLQMNTTHLYFLYLLCCRKESKSTFQVSPAYVAQNLCVTC